VKIDVVYCVMLTFEHRKEVMRVAESLDGVGWRIWLENIFSRADAGHRLSCLDVRVRGRFRLLLLGLVDRGYSGVVVTGGLRTLREERRLFGLGRSVGECQRARVPGGFADPGSRKVTWIVPEKSKHVLGKAIDVSWIECEEPTGKVVSQLCTELGMRWGGDWKVRDECHFEVR
jgi:hypothetical protein